jgi:hypothetical protein
MVTVLRVLPVSAALTGLAAADLDLPSARFWDDKQPWLYACLIVAFAVTAAGQSLAAVAFKGEADRVRRFEAEIHAGTAATLQGVANKLGVDLDKVGVHVFLVSGISFQGRWWFSRLVHVGRLRIGAKPSMHRPRWSIGKGVVGRAWQANAYVAEDWRTVYDRGQTLGRDAWNALPPDDRYQMSWTELFETADYRLIAARPVLSLHNGGGRVIGCVSVDAQAPLPASQADLQSILADLAQVVSGVALPPKAWLSQRKHGY